MALRLREAVRAVVVDDAQRVLLVRFQFADGPLWAAPGGGIDDGESPETALRRELQEEVSVGGVEVGPAIWRRTHIFPLSARHDGQREVFHLVHAQPAAGVAGFSVEQLLAEGVTGSQWSWTLGQLRAAQDTRFAPRRFVEHFATLLAEGPPSEVVDVGV